MQTEEYARELSRSGSRAQQLTSDNPLRLHAAINEQALRLRVGTPEIMGALYRHLIDMSSTQAQWILIESPNEVWRKWRCRRTTLFASSKTPESGRLTVPPAQWLAFLTRVTS